MCTSDAAIGNRNRPRFGEEGDRGSHRGNQREVAWNWNRGNRGSKGNKGINRFGEVPGCFPLVNLGFNKSTK